jgi:hypothetical protein
MEIAPTDTCRVNADESLTCSGRFGVREFFNPQVTRTV